MREFRWRVQNAPKDSAETMRLAGEMFETSLTPDSV